jgi:hypothetical protein
MQKQYLVGSVDTVLANLKLFPTLAIVTTSSSERAKWW